MADPTGRTTPTQQHRSDDASAPPPSAGLTIDIPRGQGGDAAGQGQDADGQAGSGKQEGAALPSKKKMSRESARAFILSPFTCDDRKFLWLTLCHCAAHLRSVCARTTT